MFDRVLNAGDVKGYFKEFKDQDIWPVGKKYPQEKIFFGFKYPKMITPEGRRGWWGVTLQVPLSSSQCAFYFPNALLFPELPFHFLEVPFFFLGIALLFSRNVRLFFQKWLFVSQKCPIVFQNWPLVLQKFYISFFSFYLLYASFSKVFFQLIVLSPEPAQSCLET